MSNPIPYIAQIDASRHTLLVIDDQPTNLNIVVDYLSQIGFRVLTARSGMSGLQRAQRSLPDLILLDGLMPNMDGFETCRRLKVEDSTKHIPVIFMTALTDTSHKVQAFEAGAVDYITKPIQHEEMLARITTHLRLRILTHNLEEAVVQRTAELTRANQNLEAVLFALSHDLREPLRTIHTFTELVTDRYSPQFDERGRDYQQRVVRAATRMQQMLDSVFLLSAVGQAKRPPEPIAGEDVVTAVLDNFQHEIDIGQIEVTIAEHYPALHAEKGWAIQALYQLVENAVKHAAHPTEPTKIVIDPYQSQAEHGFIVRDRGAGLTSEKIERNFQLFQRSVRREVTGVGAGLTIARQIAEHYQGNLSAQPRNGGGMNFILTFGHEG